MTCQVGLDPVSVKAASDLQLAGEGGSVLFVLPTVRHRDAVRERFLLQPCPVGASRVGAYSFSRLTQQVLGLARDPRRLVDEPVVRACLESLTLEMAARGEIPYYSGLAGSPGLADSLAKVFVRFAEAMVDPDALEGTLRLEDSSLSPRERELSIIYRAYRRFLDDNQLLDLGTQTLAAIAALRRDPALLGEIRHVFVDHHPYLTAAQAELLRTMAPALTTLRFSLARGSEWVAPELGERLERLLQPVTLYRYQARDEAGEAHPVLRHLQESLFRDEVEPRAGEGRVAVFSAPGPEREYWRIAREMRRLASTGVPWREMLVVCGDKGGRALLAEVLRDEGIPVSSPETYELGSNPAIRALMLFLEQALANGAGFNLLHLVRSDYLWADGDSAAALREAWPENGRRHTSWEWRTLLAVQVERLVARVARLEAEVQAGADSDATGDEGALADSSTRLVQERHRLSRLQKASSQLDALLKIMESLPGRGAIDGYADEIARVVGELDLERRILDPGAPAEIRARDWMALHALRQLLADIKRLGGLLGAMGQDLAFSGFLRLLKAALDGYRRNLKPAVPGGVALVGADDVVGLSYRCVFVTGLNDGAFPARPTRDWLWSDSLVRRLQAAGFHVEGRDLGRLRNKAAFAEAVGAAREELRLSFSEADALGSTNLASPFLTEALRCLTDSAAVIQRVALTEMRRTRLEATIDLTSLVEVESKRLRGEVGPWSGLIADTAGLDGLAAKYDPSFRWSVTRLGEYVRCPFRYFVSRELGLAAAEELGEELSPLERGSILHAILHDFYSRHRGENLLEKDAPGLRGELREIARRRLDASSGERLALHPKLWEARRERLIEMVTKVLDNDLRLAERSFGTLRARYLEWSFGRRSGRDNDPRSTAEPFVLSRPGEELRFAGVVDRVDADSDGRFMVYDYKTGRSLPGYSQMTQGENLQLPLYVLAVKSLLIPGGEAIGGGFYSLAEPSRPFGLYRKELADLVGAERKRSGLIPGADWDETVGSLVEQLFTQAANVRNGRFGPTPLDANACRSCDFRPACRRVAAAEVVNGDE